MDSVLVIIVFTYHKQYCRFLLPKIYDSLTYPNKSLCFIEDLKYPELNRLSTGEERASRGRQIGIEKARAGNFDWLFFLDADTEPDPDIIEKMMMLNYPLVGGLHSARGDAWHCIGHNYTDRKTLNRLWLRKSDLSRDSVVDGISGGTLLIQKGIFTRCDYKGYQGPGTIPTRFTADDEWLLLNIYKSLKIRPKVAVNCRSWHYSDDGRAYRLWGEIKQWRAY